MDVLAQHSPPPVRAIIVAHGALADGLASAVQQITGRGSMFHAMSNSGLSLADIKDSVSRALDETGARVIFTDLPAGSCTMAVRKIMRARIDVTVVTGVNLSVLLDFAMHETIDPVTAARSALERGRASIVAHGA